MLTGLSSDQEYIGDIDLAAYSARVNFIITWYPPCDIVPRPKNKLSEEIANSLVLFLGDRYKKIPRTYKRASPIKRIKQDAPAMLFIHGKKDSTVSYMQSSRFHEWANHKIGVKMMELILVENAGHTGFKKIGEEAIFPSLKYIQKKTFQFGYDHIND